MLLLEVQIFNTHAAALFTQTFFSIVMEFY
jgi:hypothetical protein